MTDKVEEEGLERAGSFAYLFEAKGIQRYVFDSGPLRDLVGASDLVASLAQSSISESGERSRLEAGSASVDELCRDLIGRVWRAVHSDPKDTMPRFSRRAGGAFCLHSKSAKELDEVRVLWRLAAMLRCPGLEMTDSRSQHNVGSAKPDQAALDAMQEAYDNAPAPRDNTAAELPPPGHPLTAFVARTGRPTTKLFRYGDDIVEADALAEPQRRRADSLRGRNDGVALRFLGKDPKKQDYRFPRNLDADEVKKAEKPEENPIFPFRGDDTRVAVVHADLSGLGQTFMKAKEKGRSPEDIFRLAQSIEAAIEAAAQRATAASLLPQAIDNIVPARPIVLGGDDITVLVRADLALPFTKKLLDEIESQTKASLKELTRTFRDALPENLSACAGVAIVRRGQPFLMASAIADDLCKLAKDEVKKASATKDGRQQPFASAIAFHLVGTTLQERYDDILMSEVTAKHASQAIRLTGNPYGVELRACEAKRSTYSALLELAKALADVKGGLGNLREMQRLAFADLGAADARWSRWWQVAREKNKPGIEAVRDALHQLGLEAAAPNEDPPWHTGGEASWTPLFDALDLIDIGAITASTEMDRHKPKDGGE